MDADGIRTPIQGKSQKDALTELFAKNFIVIMPPGVQVLKGINNNVLVAACTGSA